MTTTAGPLLARLDASLDEADRLRLAQVRRAAGAAGWPAYLAGGLVRDLLLGRPVTDLDFVVVPRQPAEAPPAPRLARALARAHGGTVTVHAPFGTATWNDPAGGALDFATARTETYARPGALPAVAPAPDIETDLRRRDFTINAMALRVDGNHLGELVDPHGGQADLEAGCVRVLHPLSFQDDPTRLFRAVRQAQRLGFRLAPETEALVPAALTHLAAVSGERLRTELDLTFRETNPPAVLERLSGLSVLTAVHSALRWDPVETEDAALIHVLPRLAWQWAAPPDLSSLYLTLLLRQASHDQAVEALSRLAVRRVVAEAVRGAQSLQLTATRPSQVVEQLDGLSLNGLAAAYVAWPAARDRLDAYLSRWRFVRATLTGDSLLAMGLAPGPHFKHILGRLRAARLDGEISDEAGERALVRELTGLE